MKLNFTIPLAPRSKKNSPRVVKGRSRKVIVLPSAAFEEYQEKCGYYIPCKWACISQPVNVCMKFYTDTRRRVDKTNLESAMLDVLVHYGVLADDCRDIVYSTNGTCVEWDRNNPRTEIAITELDGVDVWRKK